MTNLLKVNLFYTPTILLKFFQVGNVTKARPNPGDVYLTRHANLQASEIGGKAGGGGGIEVIFHVVSEGEALGSDAASPALPSHLHTAIGTVLRFCSQHDINTLSLPLLFTRRPLEVSLDSCLIYLLFRV